MCGYNYYNKDEQSIQFVLQGADCEILVKLVDVVSVNAKLDMNFDDFFKNDGPTRFIDNMAAYLGIDPSKIKIAKIVPGSVIIDFVIIPAEKPDTAADEPEPMIVNSQETADKVEEAKASGDTDSPYSNVISDEITEDEFYEAEKAQ